MNSQSLATYVVYENPSDFPNKWVVRRQIIIPNGSAGSIMNDQTPLCVAENLEAARASIPESCYQLDRHPEDDPVIFEVWI